MEERVKLTLALSIPIWAAMSIFAIAGGIFGGVSGLGVAFAAVFFATIFWFVTLTRVLGEPREMRSYGGAGGGSVEGRLSSIEEKLNEIARAKKE